MRVLWLWIERYGIPKAIYVGWKNIYVTKREPTAEEQLAGELPLTQFGKACRKLDIEIITASSPQTKGRVERKHGVYQDRCVKALLLAGINDIEKANQSLSRFAEKLNARFAVEPRGSTGFHRPVPEDMDLRHVFCLEESRTVGNGWVVRYKNRLFQIVSQSNLPLSKGKVIMQEHLDGSVRIACSESELIVREICELPRKPAVTQQKQPNPQPRRKHIPPPDHPWRRFSLQTRRFSQALSV